MDLGEHKSIVAVFAASFALMSGCGDSDSSRPSKQAYIQQANRICKKAYDERSAAVERVSVAIAKDAPQSSVAQEQQRIVLEGVLPVEKKMVAELGSLTVPEGEEEEIQRLIEQYEEKIAAYEADPGSAFEAPSTTGANQSLRQYGLSVEYCSI